MSVLASSEDDLLQLASSLCADAALARPARLAPMAGGRNNRVYLVTLQDGHRVVLKRYHHDVRDSRDRCGAEVAFLKYLESRGVARAPRLLASEAASHSALFDLVRGDKLAPGAVTDWHVCEAAAFILAANAAPREIECLTAASEACFSYGDHVDTIDRRVKRLADQDATVPHAARAGAFIAKTLKPVWDEIRDHLAGLPGLAMPLPLTSQIASPSDFGFHNALVDDDKQIVFIDFEYAGRDDPAKLVCDFFCSPEVPVPLNFMPRFIEPLRAGLPADAMFPDRCVRLLDAYRVKWACIILNDFLPVGTARRSFAKEPQDPYRYATQIEKAAAKIAEVGTY